MARWTPERGIEALQSFAKWLLLRIFGAPAKGREIPVFFFCHIFIIVT